jgi:hypothetical protein
LTSDAAPRVDLLGTPISADDQELLDCYERLKALLARDLDPCVEANVRAAVAALWNAVVDRGLIYEHLTDLGV